MDARIRKATKFIHHYGGLGLFFACYISLCYAITGYMLIHSAQSPLSDESHGEPSTRVQISQLATVKHVPQGIYRQTGQQQDVAPASDQTEENVTPITVVPSPAPLEPETPSSEPSAHLLAELLQKQQDAIQKLLRGL